MTDFLIIALVFFSLGYFIGRRNDPITEKIKYRARKLGTILTRKASNTPASGIIYRPNASRLRQIKGDKKPEVEAIVETLEQLPEIQAAKKALRHET